MLPSEIEKWKWQQHIQEIRQLHEAGQTEDIEAFTVVVHRFRSKESVDKLERDVEAILREAFPDLYPVDFSGNIVKRTNLHEVCQVEWLLLDLYADERTVPSLDFRASFCLDVLGFLDAS